jgi:hypothetical protein
VFVLGVQQQIADHLRVTEIPQLLLQLPGLGVPSAAKISN